MQKGNWWILGLRIGFLYFAWQFAYRFVVNCSVNFPDFQNSIGIGVQTKLGTVIVLCRCSCDIMIFWYIHLKMDGSNTSFLLGWPIFRCYVGLRECMILMIYIYIYKCIVSIHTSIMGLLYPRTTHSGKWRQWKVFCLFTAYMIYQHLKACFTWINRNTLEALDQPARCPWHQVVERSCKKKCEKHRQSHHQRRRCSWFYAVRKHLSTPRSGEKLLFLKCCLAFSKMAMWICWWTT